MEQEIRRPTFVHRDKPLPEVCGFLSFDELTRTAEGIRSLKIASSVKPDFLLKIAEFFTDEDE